MLNKRNFILVAAFVCILFSNVKLFSMENESLSVVSPNGRIEVLFESAGGANWSIRFDDKWILNASSISYNIDNQRFGENVAIIDVAKESNDSFWHPAYGEQTTIRDNYNQSSVTLEDNLKRRLILQFRAYDEGVAMRAIFPKQAGRSRIIISSEDVEFSLSQKFSAWVTYTAQGPYSQRKLANIGSDCERPLTLSSYDKKLYLSIAEAAMHDYSRMKLKFLPAKPNTIVSQLDSPVVGDLPFQTPWRVVFIADKPGDLLQHNYLILNLNEPSKLADTSWIVPGKMMRDASLSIENCRAIVDLAPKLGLDYLHIDAGWYGHEYNDRSDATTITPDITRCKDPDSYDLKEIIRYAHSKGVKVMLYVNRRHLERQLDEILPLYKSWGVDGIKFGFVNVGPQYWTNWLHESIAKCADYGMIVDVHDEYRPTGYERTYPNFLTAEGIRGNEALPSAEQNLVNPFSRFLCGPADNTFCWWSYKLQNSWAHQMASTVVYYSPLQFLFWYDQAEKFTGDEEYLFFFRKLKTVWDEKRVLQGEIGEYVTVARRSGEDWFVGSMNAVKRRKLPVALDFLQPKTKYTAYIYRDTNPDKTTIRQVVCEQMSVTSETVLMADMAANGGQAIYITKQ